MVKDKIIGYCSISADKIRADIENKRPFDNNIIRCIPLRDVNSFTMTEMPSEILSFTKPIGEQKKISIQNINKYYTYLDASVDYVLSIEIIVKDCLITQYSYTYKPNMSDVIISYTCVFTYDKNNRVVKLKKEYRKHYETIEFIYETK